MPDCWLEVSLHPTGQLDQGFPWFSLTLGWIALFMADMSEGTLHREERK
jgi:hypothetical protein